MRAGRKRGVKSLPPDGLVQGTKVSALRSWLLSEALYNFCSFPTHQPEWLPLLFCAFPSIWVKIMGKHSKTYEEPLRGESLFK